MLQITSTKKSTDTVLKDIYKNRHRFMSTRGFLSAEYVSISHSASFLISCQYEIAANDRKTEIKMTKFLFLGC